jgi:hypothetical protein
MGIRNVGVPLPQLWPEEGVFKKLRGYIPQSVPLFDGIYFFPLFLLLCHWGKDKTKRDD